MKRYFKQFFPGVMLEEISKAEADKRSHYILERSAPRRYERFDDGTLAGVFYPNTKDPSRALSDFRARYENSLFARIYSPFERAPKESSVRIWFAPGGTIERSLRYVYQKDKKDHRIYHYDADGALVDYRDFIYEDWGLAEIWTYDKDGVLLRKSDELP